MFLLYGANGYTGELIARTAVERGLRPILAGRDPEAIPALARELGLEHRVASLDDADGLDAALADVPVVLHCAGPFVRTAAPMVEACLRTGTHYLDITGEIGVFEALAARDREARDAGVMLLPGTGFDVVPTDCLAAHLKRRLPGATRLALAFRSGGRPSRGTLRTALEALGRGGAVRRGGRIRRVPAAWKTRSIDLGRGPVPATTVPWGDVATAYHSTGIGDVEVYTVLPASVRRLLVASRYLGWLLARPAVRRFLERRIEAGPPGPSAAARQRARGLVWGEVEDDAGRRAVSRLRTPEGYTLTALASLLITRKVLDGAAPAGFRTPSLAYGPDLVLEIAGTGREDVV